MSGNLFVYKASAGSGKTFQLARRYIYNLFDAAYGEGRRGSNTAHRHILAVTFTNKATNEMKQRIITELYRLKTHAPSAHRTWLQGQFPHTDIDGAAGSLLHDLLRDYTAFQVSTIDSFFQRIVRAFARELGLPGAYAIQLDSDEALEEGIDELYSEIDEGHGGNLERVLSDIMLQRVDNGKGWDIRDNIRELGKQFFLETYQNRRVEMKAAEEDTQRMDNYRVQLRQEVAHFEATLQQKAQRVLDMLTEKGLRQEMFSYGTQRFSSIRDLAGGKIELSNKKIYLLLNRRFVEMTIDASLAVSKKSKDGPQILHAMEDGLQHAMRDVCNYVKQHVGAYYVAQEYLQQQGELMVMQHLLSAVNRVLQNDNTMLMADTNSLVSRLIDGSDSPFLYEKVGVMLRHFMIDEFQDTSLLQWRNFYPLILECIARGDDNLVVGDVKQSIYRWRNSDWSLMLHVMDNTSLYPRELETRNTNYRSRPNVVKFNNAFFSYASHRVTDCFAAVANVEGARATDDAAHLAGQIAAAYDGLRQDIGRHFAEAEAGYIDIQFINAGKRTKDEQRADMLQQVLQTVRTLDERGVPLERVAVLVNRNRFAQQVADCLVEAGMNVVSEVGLLVKNSSAVRMMLSAMRLTIDPHSSTDALVLGAEYQRHLDCQPVGEQHAHADNVTQVAAYAAAVADKHAATDWRSLFTPDEQALLTGIEQLPLYELAERLVTVFHVGTWPGQAAFVQTFMDAIHSFACRRRADVRAFLDWWDQTGCKQAIPTPEIKGAVRIMTIHKAKGLEYEYAIVPFCESISFVGRANNAIWLNRIDDNDPLPMRPMTIRHELMYTDYASDYYNEMMQRQMDGLNVLYVALTRAVSELYCIAAITDDDNDKKKGNSIVSNAADLLWSYFEDGCACDARDAVEWHHEDMRHTAGHMVQPVGMSRPKGADATPCVKFDSVTIGERLTVRRRASEFYVAQRPIEQSVLKRGTLMHDLLSRIQTRADEATAIEDMLRDGIVTPLEADVLQKEMQRFWTIDKVTDWFDERWTVLNERTIIDAQGNEYRPDRLIVDGRQAVVVDYKFGATSQRHVRQVQRYARLLNEMGYDVEAWLCYVNDEPHAERVPTDNETTFQPYKKLTS